MKLHVSGKLKTTVAKQPSFEGFRIEAVFEKESASRRVTALSDEAGNFTLVFPKKLKKTCSTVKFTVLSPAGGIIGEMEVMTANLGEAITIEVETADVEPPDEPTPTIITSQSVAVDAIFRSDAALRRAITNNLKPLRGESEAVAARVEKAWNFRPSQLSAEELEKRHYVPPGSDPGEVLNKVIMSGVDALRSTETRRSLTLRKSAELKKLIKTQQEGEEALQESIELDQLIEFIQQKGAGPFQSVELNSTPYKAEARAEAILNAIGNSNGGLNGELATRQEALTAEILETEDLVKNAVNMQMQSATAPESQVTYARLPNRADDDEAQQTILQNISVREGPTDVIAYHDFHTLQIAFKHVWTEIFDGQLASLGRDLYIKYVELKDFTGSTAPDMQVGTIADLRQLIDEVRKLSQFVDEEIPASLRPPGNDQTGNGLPSPTPEDVARGGGALATGGVSLFIEWAFNELIKAGNKPVRVTWNEFPLKLNEGRGNIIELRPVEQNALPPGIVEIVLETDANSYKKKVSFQQWDRDTQRPIYSADLQNFGGGRGPIDRLMLNAAQVQSGTLKFISEDEVINELLLGRYVLGDLGERLKERTRLTFRWRGQR